MLHYTVAWWLWARGTPVRKHFPEIARHSGEQCSIGFQPVSGFGAETGLNPNGPFPARTIPNSLYLRAIQPWAKFSWPLRAVCPTLNTSETLANLWPTGPGSTPKTALILAPFTADPTADLTCDCNLRDSQLRQVMDEFPNIAGFNYMGSGTQSR